MSRGVKVVGRYNRTQEETKGTPLWHTRITITQAPEPFIPQHLPEEAVPFYQKREDIRTFLYDPFGGDPPKIYGLELTANENVKVRFFTQVESREAAIKSGYAWLSNLKYKFRGLDGIVEAISISNQEPRVRNNLLEIVLPNGFIKSKISIVERLINAFYYLKDHKVHLFLLWRREPSAENSEERSNLFNIRIFVEYYKENPSQKEKPKLEGILDFLAMDIENREGRRAKVISSENISLLDILEGTVFKDENDTYRTFIPEDVDFDFPEKLPLPRLPILQNENVRYIDINEKFKRHAIRLGYHIKDGVITDHVTFLSINKLPQDLAIFGKSGSGKTYFLARFINELASKAKGVGILVLNVANESQEI
ncbi:MAG: helicase HerA domain-containing protein, partial [Promethearchaeota archaeon]